MQAVQPTPWTLDIIDPYDSLWLEEDHFEREQKFFISPMWIGSKSPAEPSRTLVFRSYFRRTIVRKLDSLLPEDCKPFCWKDFAVYGIGALPSLDKHALLKCLYREWFPHRTEDKHAGKDQSFLAKFMYFGEPYPSLREIALFHDVLCAKLRELEPDVGNEPDEGAVLTVPREQYRKLEYQLRPTFMMAFIVISAGWRERGVQLVWQNVEDAVKNGCWDGQEATQGASTGKTLCGQGCVIPCSLQEAVRLIVSASTDQANRSIEQNE